MKLSSKEALNILKELGKDSKNKYWIEHSIYVGNSGEKIAQALNEKGCDVSIDKAKTLGYIHDIGKYSNDPHGHIMRGYKYLKEKGYDDEYCNICLTHSFLNNDILCTAGGVPDINVNLFLADFIKNPIVIKNNTNKEIISEKLFQQLILEDISSFLQELGNGFSFVKSEYKIKIGNNYHYIDLLLYNYIFNCFVCPKCSYIFPF